jgi:hypothetical protein
LIVLAPQCATRQAKLLYKVRFLRLPSYQRSSLSRERATRVPRMMIANDRERMCPAEYIRNFRAGSDEWFAQDFEPFQLDLEIALSGVPA